MRRNIVAKFTVILEFAGATYIRQVKAASPLSALKKIAAGNHGKTGLFRALSEDKPVAIEGVEKCWCCSSVHRGQLALVNIVETAE
jgi:hypothetical protein